MCLWFLSQIHTSPAEDSPCPEGTDLSEMVRVNLNLQLLYAGMGHVALCNPQTFAMA